MRHPVIAVSDSVFPNLNPAREVLSRVGAELLLAEEPTPEAIMQVARNADAVLVTYAKITAEMISPMTRCRIIARFGIGVDNVDIPAATKAGIVVTRVPDYCIDEVSDHTMALLLALARKIPFANSRAHAGHWEMPAVVPIYRLRGSVLGLAGFGRIPTDRTIPARLRSGRTAALITWPGGSAVPPTRERAGSPATSWSSIGAPQLRSSTRSATTAR